VAVHASSEVESLRRSCPVPHGAADTAAAFHILPSTAATHQDHAKAPCTGYARWILSSVVTQWGRLYRGASAEPNVRGGTLKVT